MSDCFYRDPTFNAAVAMEVREKKGCGVCIRRIELLGRAICGVNKTYPRCKYNNDNKGFKYDLGE